MADIRSALGNFVTPPGRLCAPLYLNEPDGKFDDSPGKLKYKAGILICGPEAAAFLATVEEVWEGWLARVKAASGKKPKTKKKNIQWFTADTPRWDDMGASTEKTLDGLEPGEALFKTSMKAVHLGRNGKPDEARTPHLFDANGSLMTDPPNIGFGTTGRIEGFFYGYTNAGVANISLLLKNVQIIELREPGAGGDESHGFSATDGYVHEAETFPAANAAEGDY